MKVRRRFLLGALLLLALAPTYALDKSLMEDPAFSDAAKIAVIRREISTLNLLNGLYLTQEQLDKLIALGEKAVEARRAYMRQLADRSADYHRELESVRDTLYGGRTLTSEQSSRAFQFESRLELVPRQKAAEDIGRLEDEARAVLGEGRVAIIETFKPCLIPPKTLSDPVAVGQASATEKEEAVLDMIRRMPDSFYQKQRETVAQKIVSLGEREKGKMPEDVRAGAVRAYLGKMDEARRMSDVDFQLKKKDLGKSFQLFNDEVTYHKGREREPGKISQFLLTEEAVEVMKKWRAARRNDPAETADAVVSETAAATPEGRTEAFLLSIYTRVTFGQLRECVASGKLKDPEKDSLFKTLAQAKEANDPRRKYEAIAKVADRVNALSLTKSSVDSMLVKLGLLCIQKRVFGVVRPKGQKIKLVEDVTGLGEKVEEARALQEKGDYRAACQLLKEVEDCLAQFKD